MRRWIESSLYWGKVISLGVILGLGIQFAQAWTNPTVSPPGGNLAGPITTGAVDQIKSASLGLTGSLIAGGVVKVGSGSEVVCSEDNGGAIRFNTITNCLEYCDRTAWVCTNTNATQQTTLPYMKVYTQTMTPSGRYLGTYDDFRGGGVNGISTSSTINHICQSAGKTGYTPIVYSCAPGGSTGTESRHNGSWGYYNTTGQGWCESTGVDWVACWP